MTEIGVGKVIKGWDEGRLRSIYSDATLTFSTIAVPQLSLGQKARLVASADYVCPPILPSLGAYPYPCRSRLTVLGGFHP